jgi:RNA polymerase sigma-70 factor (ECF subfamily)
MPENPPDDDEFLPTRKSLLSRLRDLDDQEGWREFFDTYWRLIYGVARKAGLTDAESQDVVQETMLVVTRHMPEFRFDPAIGSFKTWLHTVIRSRLGEHFRSKNRVVNRMVVPAEDPTGTGTGELEKAPDPAEEPLDGIWQAEWERHILDTALRRVRRLVSSRQYLMFNLAVVKQVPYPVICRKLDANIAQIYLARHRVGKLMKAEIARLRRAPERPGQ